MNSLQIDNSRSACCSPPGCAKHAAPDRRGGGIPDRHRRYEDRIPSPDPLPQWLLDRVDHVGRGTAAEVVAP